MLIALPVWSAKSNQRDTLRIVVPFSAGGTTDLSARILADAITQSTGQQVLVENRPGGFVVVGMEYLMRQPADGRTLFVAASGITTQRHYLPNTREAVRELSPISILAESPMVLLVPNSLEVNDVREFIHLAGRSSNSLTYASVGLGGAVAMATDLFAHAAKLTLTSIPYQGNSAATIDLMAGRINMLFDSIGVGAQTIQSGQVRALATTGRTRSRLMPDVPTFSELGYNIDFSVWQAVFVASSTPDSIQQELNQMIHTALINPLVRQRYLDLGMERVLNTQLLESRLLIQSELDKWQALFNSR